MQNIKEKILLLFILNPRLKIFLFFTIYLLILMCFYYHNNHISYCQPLEDNLETFVSISENNSNVIYYVIGGTLVIGTIIAIIYFSGGFDPGSGSDHYAALVTNSNAETISTSIVQNDLPFGTLCSTTHEDPWFVDKFDLTNTYEFFFPYLGGNNFVRPANLPSFFIRGSDLVDFVIQRDHAILEQFYKTLHFAQLKDLCDPRLISALGKLKDTPTPASGCNPLDLFDKIALSLVDIPWVT